MKRERTTYVDKERVPEDIYIYKRDWEGTLYSSCWFFPLLKYLSATNV